MKVFLPYLLLIFPILFIVSGAMLLNRKIIAMTGRTKGLFHISPLFIIMIMSFYKNESSTLFIDVFFGVVFLAFGFFGIFVVSNKVEIININGKKAVKLITSILHRHDIKFSENMRRITIEHDPSFIIKVNQHYDSASLELDILSKTFSNTESVFKTILNDLKSGVPDEYRTKIPLTGIINIIGGIILLVLCFILLRRI